MRAADHGAFFKELNFVQRQLLGPNDEVRLHELQDALLQTYLRSYHALKFDEYLSKLEAF